MGIPVSLLNCCNAMTAILSESRNSSGLEIDVEIRCDQQWSFAQDAPKDQSRQVAMF
jgi:hypothetical protein